MTEHEPINYPDLLGAVTGGPRLNVNVVQCALAARPAAVPAGRFFALVCVLQNASDIDVDVVATPALPERDRAGQKGRFVTRSARLRIGLRPAEVGYLTLPISTSALAAPGEGYRAGMRLDVKRLDRHPQRVRLPEGGGAFLLAELPAETQSQIETLRALPWSAEAAGQKSYCETTFTVQPPAISSLQELKPAWKSLWTMRDYLDEYTIAQKVWPSAEAVLPKLNRECVFMPLLKATQERFSACGYALQPPEAIYITKLLTLILEMGVQEPSPAEPHPAWPHWFARMCRLLLQEPALATQPEVLASRLLYVDLAYDAIVYGFSMLRTVMNENFGAEDEVVAYSEDVVGALAEARPLDFARTYLPLVLGGLVANTRVTMPREQVRETVFILSKAVETRRTERTADNAFIFDMTDRLVERALEGA